MPDGPQFECKVRAFVGENPDEKNLSHTSSTSSSSRYDSSLKSTDRAPELFTNKTQLSWGGVKIGSSFKQTLILRAGPKETTAFKFRVAVKGTHASSFQVNFLSAP